MTPKEKAEELFNKFIPFIEKYYNERWMIDKSDAKGCALILIDEILKVSEEVYFDEAQIKYWQLVKEEIVNL